MSYFATVKTQAAKGVGLLNNWTAVGQNAVVSSNVLDVSTFEACVLHLHAFLDSTTAHSGTQILVQTSSNTSGDMDWTDLSAFVILIGTAAKQNLTNNPAATGTTVLTITGTTSFTGNGWKAIKDSTLINSELIYQTTYSNNTSITVLNGTTNSHAQYTPIWNLATTQQIVLPSTVNRVKIVVDNSYTSNGSTLNYKLRYTYATSL